MFEKSKVYSWRNDDMDIFQNYCMVTSYFLAPILNEIKMGNLLLTFNSSFSSSSSSFFQKYPLLLGATIKILKKLN